MEGAVADMLDERGYVFVDRFRFFPARILEQTVYTRQCVVGTDIYGRTRRVDAILHHPLRWPDYLVVQCKWQSVGGSVEEKYPFEALFVAGGGFDTVIVLDGGGYSEGARNWLTGRVGCWRRWTRADSRDSPGRGCRRWRTARAIAARVTKPNAGLSTAL